MSEPKTNEKQERPMSTDLVHGVQYSHFPSLGMLRTATATLLLDISGAPVVYTCLLNYRQEPSCHRATRAAASTPPLGGRMAICGSKPTLLLVPAEGILVIAIPGQGSRDLLF